MDAVMIVAVVGFAVLCGAVSLKIAAGKGRSPVLWGLVGLVFNLPGLLVAVVVPKARVEECVSAAVRPAPSGAGKPSRPASAAIA